MVSLVVVLVPVVLPLGLEEPLPDVGGGGLPLLGPSAYSGAEATASTKVRTINCQSFFMRTWGSPWVTSPG